MSNTVYWDQMCKVPPEAQKEIGAGRLKGMTDINPQWRFKIMTEVFGPCGMGWKYTIDKLWTEPGNEEQVMAFALVSVYAATTGINGEFAWSEPIPGIGGSMLVTKESKGLYTSDEGYKMAVTDALSVAMKALGIGANIYLGAKFQTKYEREQQEAAKKQEMPEIDSAVIDSLQGAATLDALVAAWSAIPASKRAAYTAIKDTRKKELSAT